MATKSAYDDVFSGYKKKVPFPTTALSPRTEDYAEIFGGGCLRGTSTSIPVLDLPPADVAGVPVSFREGCGRFDYSEVFGGGTEAIESLAVFEEVFRERFNDSNSDEAWTPAQSETLSDESEPFVCTDSYQSISNADFHHSSNDMKHFKVSYNKVFHTSESDMTNGVAHVAELNDVPGYSFLVDEPPPLQKMVVINNLKHEGVGMEEGKPLRKTTGCDNKSFVTISDISLKTRPSHLPPPLRPPPVVGPKDRDNSTQSSKIKVSRTFSSGETTSDDNSPLFYDVEVDVSTSATVSVAAMQDVMEKAQKKLKSAKHKKDRSKIASGRDLGAVDGLANDSTKHGTGYGLLQEPSLKNEENVEWKQDDEFYEVTETIDCRNLIIVRDKRRVAVHDFRACQVISQQDEFNSKMKRDDDILEKIMVEAVEGEDLVKLIKVQKNEDKDERKCSNDLGLEENGIRLGENIEREAKERAKNEKRLKESSEWEEKEKKDREAWEREEKEKSEKEARDRELGEKIIREAIEKEENEKRLRLALEEKERKSRVAWEREEKEKSEKDDREREFERNRIREAIEKEKKEKRLRLALAEKEKKRREAWEIEEREKKERQAREREFEEKRLQEAIEKEENEKRLRLALEENERKIREAHEREEKEEREKEAREREDKEKREKEAREREDKEKREKEARERKENEKREKEVREREEKEEREKEAREREEKEERGKEAREREEKEEREKEAREIEEKEKRENETRERKEKEQREKEALEREIEENSLKKAYEENEKKQREAYERKIKEKRDKKAHERELEEKLQREAIEQEENEIRLKIAVKKEESEKKEELFSETEGEKRLEDDQMWPNIEDVPNNTFQNEENTEKVKAGCGRNEYTQEVQEVHEREVNGKRSEEAFEQDAIDKMWEEDYGLHKNVAFCGDASKVDKDSGEVKRTNGPFIVEDSAKATVQVGDLSSFGVARGNLQHENSEIKVGETKVSLPMHDITFEFEKKPFNKTGSLAEPNVVDSDLGEGGAIPKKVQVGKEKKQVKVEVQRQNAERKVKSLDDVHIREERMKREREQENERLRKIEKEREREKEREKDRMAVNMACSERENTDARLTEARERLAKINAEAKLRAERAAVERVTAEARERAFQKAKAGKATVENRERIDRTQSSVRSDSCPGVRSTNGSINAYSSGNGGVEVESAERCRARLERYQRTAQRAAKALEEKNMRDLIVQRELAERNRLAEGLDAEVKRWSSGKEGNLRALLSTLQYILGPDSGWKPIHLTEVITSLAVRSAYRKATLCVHPDKLQQRGASIHQKYVCEKVFDLLKAAWNKFNSEER